MKKLSIAAKIWLSVGVYILGYVMSTGLGQIQSRVTQTSLHATSEVLFPVAQRSQVAEAAFQRTVKGFADAVILQDTGALDQAAEDGKQAVAALKGIASTPGLDAARVKMASQLAATVEGLVNDAHGAYSAVLAGSMSSSVQDQMKTLATRTDEVKAKLAKAQADFAADLHKELQILGESTANQSTFSLAMFLITVVVAGVIVHLTIRRSITGPVVRVIGGVQNAAQSAAQAAVQMAQSGTEVSANAQEQAACIEETSASLEEISATTRQNADRAGQADRLMQEARSTVERAAGAMQELTASMNLISNSSHQVATVLKNIDEIAFHTNILALNAAVEAARAGEAGAGFSVVADEVRSLARRAAEAAKHSGETIEQTLKDVSKGVDLVNRAHEAFQEVAGTIASGTQVVSQIAVSSGEQALGITNIGQAIVKIESLTQRNVQNAQQTADGAAAMNSQVEATRRYLDDLVSVVGMNRR